MSSVPPEHSVTTRSGKVTLCSYSLQLWSLYFTYFLAFLFFFETHCPKHFLFNTPFRTTFYSLLLADLGEANCHPCIDSMPSLPVCYVACMTSSYQWDTPSSRLQSPHQIIQPFSLMIKILGTACETCYTYFIIVFQERTPHWAYAPASALLLSC